MLHRFFRIDLTVALIHGNHEKQFLGLTPVRGAKQTPMGQHFLHHSALLGQGVRHDARNVGVLFCVLEPLQLSCPDVIKSENSKNINLMDAIHPIDRLLVNAKPH